jgi:CheY-like chemotaxis protein
MSAPHLNSILLIDDDEISNLFNKIFIGKLKLDVKINVVANGKEALGALSIFKDTPEIMPCLLLLDIKMPVMDGWQFLDAYDTDVGQSVKENIVIVMLTTSQDETDMIKAMENPNIKEFIQKPLSDRIFRELISKYFGNNIVI